MQTYNADLHIHSPHSIAVSKSLNLDTMVETSKKKGLHILGTGDILQPEWLTYMENNLEKKNGTYSFKDINFILQTEIEDQKNIHEIIFFPNFDAVKEVQKKLEPHSKNIYGAFGGRPRVNLDPPELVEIVADIGCLVGPAHAFTPFKAIFRQNQYETLEDCYEDAVKKVNFLELGLSANSDLADRLNCLENITFLSNSDAHSQGPSSLGREFNRFELESPSFKEIQLALARKDGRKITLNVGLHPKLGKYYNMFCYNCRRRILFKQVKKNINYGLNQYTITDNFILFFSNNPDKAQKDYINQVAKNKMICPACKEETKKNYKVKLGVSERIEVISSYEEPKHPEHRPSYINAIPLIDIIRSVKGIKSKTSKTVLNIYNKAISELGTEFEILIDIPLKKIEKFDPNVASVIKAFRGGDIEYTPGGGGTYGEIKLEI